MHNAPYHHRRDFQYVLNHEFYIDDAGISHYAPFLRTKLKERGIQSQPWQRENENWLKNHETMLYELSLSMNRGPGPTKQEPGLAENGSG